MPSNNPELLEKEIEKKINCRAKRKKPKMKVSGRRVFELRKIISQ